MNKPIDSSSKELNEVKDGLLIGVFAGVCLGAVLGVAVGMASGSLDAKIVYKSSVAFGLIGAAIGAYTPV
jgi:outer membrane lipoprotein SlyB